MSIRAINKDTKFDEGMFVCASRGRGRSVSGPHRIIKVTAAQVTAVLGDRTKNIRLKDLTGYVTETEKEGFDLFDLLLAREAECDRESRAAAEEARKCVLSAWKPRVAALMIEP